MGQRAPVRARLKPLASTPQMAGGTKNAGNLPPVLPSGQQPQQEHPTPGRQAACPPRFKAGIAGHTDGMDIAAGLPPRKRAREVCENLPPLFKTPKAAPIKQCSTNPHNDQRRTGMKKLALAAFMAYAGLVGTNAH